MPELPPPLPCRDCGTELGRSLLSCPACGALVHADELKRIAAAAQAAPTPAGALAHWRSAMELLPPDSQQFAAIAKKIDALSRDGDRAAAPAERTGGRKWKGILASGGVLLLMLAKFKSVPFLILANAKWLLLGLTKAGTFFSMFASFGVYWTQMGWKFAAGLILSIYIHEMGHVFALRRLGLAASAPMFIPGFGALIRLQQQYMTPREDARIGLAGPIWGLGAAISAALLGFAFDSPACHAIAQLGAFINLFNLTPVWSLDGARGFHAMRRRDRIAASCVFVAAWMPVNPGIALIAGAAAIYGITRKNEPEETDPRAAWEYIALCVAFGAFAWLPVGIR